MANKRSNVVILGSTGSIGEQALQVVEQHQEKFRVLALAAGSNYQKLAVQVKKYRPAVIALGDVNNYRNLKDLLDFNGEMLLGIEGLCQLAALDEADIILIALSGAVGIRPTLAGIKKSKRIALANKETLVAAGNLVMQQAREYNAPIIPVDSEHSAIFQCLRAEGPFLKNIWLTASGGPFREFSREELAGVTVEMALQHPNWKMGPKITVDSATLMNKGLEVIEAHHLFGVEYEKIKVLVQKESLIHSMVEFVDGSFLGHMGRADMRIPIQYALSYPERFSAPAPSLDFSSLSCIHFEEPDRSRFPALALAYQAGETGGTMPAVMNAANEVAVQNFLNRKIDFLAIASLVEEVMSQHLNINRPGLEEIMGSDLWAREICGKLIEKGVFKCK